MINRETYGLIVDNPILMDSEKAAKGYLESLVTKKEGYHFIYHKLTEFDFNLFDGKEKTTENTLDIYQICTNDEKFMTLFFNIHSDKCIWVPPAYFDFEFDTVIIFEKEATAKSDPVFTSVKVDKKYISEFSYMKEDDYLKYFDKYFPESMERIISNNWGVNYKTDHFPYILWDKWKKWNNQNSYSYSGLTIEEQDCFDKITQ